MHHVMISLVVAATRNRVIGRDGAMPWRLPAELRHFKQITLGHPCIMGRKTFASIGRPLPGRDSIVVSRAPVQAMPDVHSATSLQAAITIATACAAQRNTNEIMVIGGGQIYTEALPLARRIYYSEIQADLDGDTYFPELDFAVWQETACQTFAVDEANAYAVVARTLDRIA